MSLRDHFADGPAPDPTKPTNGTSVGSVGAMPAISFQQVGTLLKPDTGGAGPSASLERLRDEALAWLRIHLKDDFVPVHAVQAAAAKAGMLWSIMEMAATEHLIEWGSMGKRYWKIPKPTSWQSK